MTENQKPVSARKPCILSQNKECFEKIGNNNVSDLIRETLSDESEAIGGSEIAKFAHIVGSYSSNICRNCKISAFEKAEKPLN